ncbi:hypothetical protein [Selenomonas dianae]|uniref:Uncharacterized protein n=1 Tax=Selenomonas dianae TaxID=135079 RepID=A0ABN0SXZ2_9FIRM|nr:hypothetical protein [Selenomonas dianae]WLD81423.1 hypothetical protein QU667_06115 [Selenomonas dianae]
MMGFKDQVAADLTRVFLNPAEFAEEHDLNGSVCLCVVEKSRTEEKYLRGATYDVYEGIHGASVTVHVEARLLPEIPVEGMQFDLDGKIMLVDSCTNEAGLLSIVLHGHCS